MTRPSVKGKSNQKWTYGMFSLIIRFFPSGREYLTRPKNRQLRFNRCGRTINISENIVTCRFKCSQPSLLKTVINTSIPKTFLRRVSRRLPNQVPGMNHVDRPMHILSHIAKNHERARMLRKLGNGISKKNINKHHNT